MLERSNDRNEELMPDIDRQSMDVDIACVGFGPAMGGFLTTLSRELVSDDGAPTIESRAMPGMPLQVVCYERADDISFGVSGVVTRARAIRESFPDLDVSQIPMAHEVGDEKVMYLLDPVGAGRRPAGVRAMDKMVKAGKLLTHFANDAGELPYVPGFLRKDEGLLLSIGQFNQWVGSQLMASGLVQIWPGMPVAGPLIDCDRVVGIRLVDQGTDRQGNPDAAFMPGMDIKAGLTVVGDGPVGAVGRKLDHHFGLPEGHHQRDWAVGMKVVVQLPDDCPLEPGTVLHTLGYPEPEIFGFLYVYPDKVASAGIFVPTWFDSPVRTSYRYLQHWMMHPYLWQYLEGGTLRSWGAKSLQESGVRGEPRLVGDGYARIGEGSGSTNMLTNSGVDEAWFTGVLLAGAVLELGRAGMPFTGENLEATYVKRRRESWLHEELEAARKARDGFQRGVVTGLFGVGLTGMTGGRINLSVPVKPPSERIPSLEDYCRGELDIEELESIREACAKSQRPLHDALMDRLGWPEIPYDGKLLMSHQDALLLGGKVQAPAGYADHVHFLYPNLCEKCDAKVCIEVCSGEAIAPGDGGVPDFDREKCVHCGACIWNCSQAHPDDPDRGNVELVAGAGGLHSGEN